MYSLVVLVLDDPTLLHDLLRSWEEEGVPGATVLESTGLRRVATQFGGDDVPLLPSLDDLTRAEQRTHCTIFTVMADGLVDQIIAATERIVGDLNAPGTGILFVVPVTRVIGGRVASPDAPSPRQRR